MSDGFRAKTSNTILVKDDIGKAKRTVYDLPPQAHAYGRAEQPDLEGAREVVMSWAAHVPRPRPEAGIQNFIKLNRMATLQNVATARQGAEFRRNTSAPLLNSGPQGPPPKVIPSDVIPAFAYGRKSRPSTPISSVVGAHYAAQSEDDLANYYQRWENDRLNAESRHKIRLTKKTSTRIADVRTKKSAESQSAEERPLFKMTKFKKVPSRLMLAPLDTFSLLKLPPLMEKSSSLPSFPAQQESPKSVTA